MGASRVSDYQPRPQGGWPAQPPPSSGGPGRRVRPAGLRPAGRGYGQQGGYGQPGGYGSRGRAARPRRRRRGLGRPDRDRGGDPRHPRHRRPGRQGGSRRTRSRRRSRRPASTPSRRSASRAGRSSPSSPPRTSRRSTSAPTTSRRAQFEITSITARATGVHLSSLSFNASATIDHINGTATISYQSLANDLGNAINLPGVSSVGTITPDPADGPDAVKADFGGLGERRRDRQADQPEQDHHPLRRARRHRLAARRRVARSPIRSSPSRSCPPGSSSGPSRWNQPGHRRHRLGK